jgi:hypothetical protein
MSFVGQPTPTSHSREPSPHWSGSPTDNPRRHHWKEEVEDPHLDTDKNITRESLSDYAQQDLFIVTQKPRNKTCKVSYPIFMPKSNTHRICAEDDLFHTHGHKVSTDSQMSRIKYNYYINNALLKLR